MIQVSKTKKGKYIVVAISDHNGKVINASEPLENTSSVKKNLIANMKLRGLGGLKYQDNTLRTPQVKWMSIRGIKSPVDDKIQKPYQPK